MPVHRREEPVHGQKADAVNREQRPRLIDCDDHALAQDLPPHQNEHELQRIDVKEDDEEQRDIEDDRRLVLQRITFEEFVMLEP